MPSPLPDLSRFELQCLRRLWALGEGSVRDVHRELTDPPSYSTVRKIVERLEEKKAVVRVRLEGKAWVYRPIVTLAAMVRKEIRRFLDSLFDGSAAPLVAHLAEMDALSVADLREIERHKGGERPLGRIDPGVRSSSGTRRRTPGQGRRGRAGKARS